jgi:hypothetical protein
MACALTTGYSLDCRDSAGGVKSVYFIEIDNVSGVTSASGTISAIAKANNRAFYKYNLQRATAEASEAYNDSAENGTSFHTQTLNIVLNKMQAATRNEIALLAQNRLLAVIEDRNGKYWLYGKENGLQRAGGKSGTGKAFGDRNGYELTFVGEEKDSAMEVSSGIIAGLLTA